MRPVTGPSCTLRDEFANLSLADQAAMLMGCKFADTGLQIKLRARGDALAAHIKACEP